jgi:hypothetical protein
MSEERTDKCGAARHLGELRGEAIGEPFAFLQGSACGAGALRMAPDQLIGVEVRGEAGQVMKGQCRRVLRRTPEQENIHSLRSAISNHQ